MGACFNQLMEEETKESLAKLYEEAMRKITALEAENSFLKEILQQSGITEVDWKTRTYRTEARGNWFGVWGTVGEEEE